MKIFKYILAILSSYLLTGCCDKECTRPPAIIQTVTKTKIVKVPVACKHEKIQCDFNGSGYTPTIKLIECIVTQKRVIEACEHPKITTVH